MRDRPFKTILFTYIKKNRFIYLCGIFMVLLTGGSQVFSTRLIGWIVDVFTGGPFPFFIGREKDDAFLLLILLFLLSSFVTTVGRFGWRITLARQTHLAGNLLRRKIWDNARFFFFSDLRVKFSKGVLLNYSNSDVSNARNLFGFIIVGVVDVLFLGFFTLFAMFSIEPSITFCFLLTSSFLPWVIRKLNNLEIIRYGIAQNTLSSFNDLAGQTVTTMRMQKLTQSGHLWLRKLSVVANLYRLRRMKAVFTSLYHVFAFAGTSFLSYGVLFLMGIPYVLDGKMSVGDFVAMKGLIFLLKDPLMELGWVISDFQKAKTSLFRLASLYDNNQDISLLKKGISPKEIDPVLQVERLSFSYERTVIDRLSFRLRMGEHLGLRGKIGSGKSTLISLLSGLERKFTGRILFCGKDFDLYSHYSLRQFIGVVPMHPFLFADTIAKNISLDRDLNEDEIRHALFLTGMDRDIASFPLGIHTPLGEWGINLSGGQKQRLSLARVLVHSPRLLLLDDSLSAVDEKTEEVIFKRIQEKLKGLSLVWASHRPSSLKRCHKILDMS